jgi:thioredoxin-like negative regulator of GroEL
MTPIDTTPSTVLILFYQTVGIEQCAVFEQLKAQFSNQAKFIMVEVGHNPEVANSFEINTATLPTIVEINNGKETWRHMGAFETNDMIQHLAGFHGQDMMYA